MDYPVENIKYSSQHCSPRSANPGNHVSDGAEFHRLRLVFGRNRTSGIIAAVKIIKIGLLMMCGGVAAVILGVYLGVGSCNATSAGVLFLMLGLAMAPIGAIMTLIGLIIKVAKHSPTTS